MIGKTVNKSGYLLTGVNKNDSNNYTYREVEIPKEESITNLKQYVYEAGVSPSSDNGKIILINNNLAGSINKYFCRKLNGVKYYFKEYNGVFSVINDTIYYQSGISEDNIKNNTNAIKYYEQAYNIKEFIRNNDTLRYLRVKNAVDSLGNNYSTETYYDYGNIFDELFEEDKTKTYIEDSNSKFNAHKLQVIKNSIESNLMVAIANYNNVSTSGVNFQMPKLQDYEWEQITQNISMITFLQGLNIGGKIYNGHAIVTNNNNEEYVSEDSIYILDNHLNTYYKITDPDLLNNDLSTSNATGILNSDFERRTATATYGTDESKMEKTIYYYPKTELASYNSIINYNGSNKENVSEYVKTLANGSGNKKRLAQIYYTALGRERYGMYRVTNFLEDVQEDLRKAGN